MKVPTTLMVLTLIISACSCQDNCLIQTECDIKLLGPIKNFDIFETEKILEKAQCEASSTFVNKLLERVQSTKRLQKKKEVDALYNILLHKISYQTPDLTSALVKIGLEVNENFFSDFDKKKSCDQHKTVNNLAKRCRDPSESILRIYKDFERVTPYIRQEYDEENVIYFLTTCKPRFLPNTDPKHSGMHEYKALLDKFIKRMEHLSVSRASHLLHIIFDENQNVHTYSLVKPERRRYILEIFNKIDKTYLHTEKSQLDAFILGLEKSKIYDLTIKSDKDELSEIVKEMKEIHQKMLKRLGDLDIIDLDEPKKEEKSKSPRVKISSPREKSTSPRGKPTSPKKNRKEHKTVF